LSINAGKILISRNICLSLHERRTRPFFKNEHANGFERNIDEFLEDGIPHVGMNFEVES
jgi:predicted GNAT family N-acyltransferase